jgi:hypothetical protein
MLLYDIAALLGFDGTAIEILEGVEVSGVRPDLIVFRIGRFVGAIEAKQPLKKSQTVESISGELYDQLMHLRTVYRCPTPIVVLSTWNTWQAFWLNDDASNAMAAAKPQIQQQQQQTWEGADEGEQQNATLLHTPTKQSAQATKRKTSPPANVIKSPSKLLRPTSVAEESASDSDEEELLKREVRHSQEYKFDGTEADSVIHLLTAVIRKLAIVKITPVKAYMQDLDASACLVHPESFQWKSIKRKSGLNFTKSIDAKTESFYIWEDLGEGSFGRVFLVSAKTSHRVGVVKMIKPTIGHSANSSAARKLLLENEAKNWKLVYANTYAKDVRVVTLDKEPALLMPWFQTPKPDEREALLPKVRKCLQEHFVGNQLKHGDVAWRNVMCDKDRVVLVDLDSVDMESDDTWLNVAMDKLEAKLQ